MTAVDAGEDAVVDLRDRLLPPGDQGPRGTCVAFAVTAIHERDRTLDGELPEDLAEEVLFWGAKQVDGDERTGTRFTSADSALRRWGQPAEELWPYDESRDHRAADYAPPAEALDADNCHSSALRGVILDRSAVEDELVAGRPLVIGIPVWDEFRHGDPQPLQIPDSADFYPTRHAVTLAGFDRSNDTLLLRNSWGPDWGDGGYLWVSVDLLLHATGAWAIDPAVAAEAMGDSEELV